MEAVVLEDATAGHVCVKPLLKRAGAITAASADVSPAAPAPAERIPLGMHAGAQVRVLASGGSGPCVVGSIVDVRIGLGDGDGALRFLVHPHGTLESDWLKVEHLARAADAAARVGSPVAAGANGIDEATVGNKRARAGETDAAFPLVAHDVTALVPLADGAALASAHGSSCLCPHLIVSSDRCVVCAHAFSRAEALDAEGQTVLDAPVLCSAGLSGATLCAACAGGLLRGAVGGSRALERSLRALGLELCADARLSGGWDRDDTTPAHAHAALLPPPPPPLKIVALPRGLLRLCAPVAERAAAEPTAARQPSSSGGAYGARSPRTESVGMTKPKAEATTESKAEPESEEERTAAYDEPSNADGEARNNARSDDPLDDSQPAHAVRGDMGEASCEGEDHDDPSRACASPPEQQPPPAPSSAQPPQPQPPAPQQQLSTVELMATPFFLDSLQGGQPHSLSGRRRVISSELVRWLTTLQPGEELPELITSRKTDTGYKGITRCQPPGRRGGPAKWQAQMCVRSRVIHLGSFDDIKLASQAYTLAQRRVRTLSEESVAQLFSTNESAPSAKRAEESGAYGGQGAGYRMHPNAPLPMMNALYGAGTYYGTMPQLLPQGVGAAGLMADGSYYGGGGGAMGGAQPAGADGGHAYLDSCGYAQLLVGRPMGMHQPRPELGGPQPHYGAHGAPPPGARGAVYDAQLLPQHALGGGMQVLHQMASAQPHGYGQQQPLYAQQPQQHGYAPQLHYAQQQQQPQYAPAPGQQALYQQQMLAQQMAQQHDRQQLMHEQQMAQQSGPQAPLHDKLHEQL